MNTEHVLSTSLPQDSLLLFHSVTALQNTKTVNNIFANKVLIILLMYVDGLPDP